MAEEVEESPPIDEQLHDNILESITVLTNPSAAQEDVDEANQFFCYLSQEKLLTFAYFTTLFAADSEIEMKDRKASLFLLGVAVRPNSAHSSDSICAQLITDNSQPVLQNICQNLLAIMFGSDTELIEPAASAFSKMLARCSYVVPWNRIPFDFFNEIKPETIESSIPTMYFFLDLFFTDYFAPFKLRASEEQQNFLNNFYNFLCFFFSEEFLSSSDDFAILSP